jgi:hypothetical protein
MALRNKLTRLLYFLATVLKFLAFAAPSLTVLGVCVFIVSTVSAGIIYDMGSGGTLTREIEIKQGKLVGLRRQSTSSTQLRPVEVFLGIPYAAAPTGSQRFMPPGSPPQWMGVKYAHNFGPVCPQKLPDLNQRKRNAMSEARATYLRRLFIYLQHNQSEDCLYLNIYAPVQKKGKYWNRIVRRTDGQRLKQQCATQSSSVALCRMHL